MEGVFQLVQINTNRCLMNYLLGFSSGFFCAYFTHLLFKGHFHGKVVHKKQTEPHEVCSLVFRQILCITTNGSTLFSLSPDGPFSRFCSTAWVKLQLCKNVFGFKNIINSLNPWLWIRPYPAHTGCCHLDII